MKITINALKIQPKFSDVDNSQILECEGVKAVNASDKGVHKKKFKTIRVLRYQVQLLHQYY